MDPLTALIFSMVIATVFTKNVVQDSVFKATGKLPPSYLRQQERMKMAAAAVNKVREGRAVRKPRPSGGFRGFFADAYNDAWETADEVRRHRRAKRTAARRQKWADEGGIPTPVTTAAKPEEEPASAIPEAATKTPEPVKTAPEKPAPEPVVHDDDTYVLKGGKEDARYQRYAMRRRNGGQPMNALAIADEYGIPLAKAEEFKTEWDARYDREANSGDQPPAHLLNFQKHSKCRDCGGGIQIEKDLEHPGRWIVRAEHVRDDCPQKPTAREEHDQKVADLAAAADAQQPTGSLSQDMTDRQRELAAASARKRLAEAVDGAAEASTRHDWDAEAEHLRDAERAAAELGITTSREMTQAVDAYKHGTPAQMWEPVPAHPGNTTPINGTENTMNANAETTGLQSALAYTSAMAETTGEGVSSVETSIAALENGEVGSAVTGPLAQAQEHLAAAQAAFKEANDALTQHINVQEAYNATPDAGNKQFVTAE